LVWLIYTQVEICLIGIFALFKQVSKIIKQVLPSNRLLNLQTLKQRYAASRLVSRPQRRDIERGEYIIKIYKDVIDIKVVPGPQRGRVRTYHFDQLAQFQSEPHGQRLRVVSHRPDQSVVVGQQVVVQPLGVRVGLDGFQTWGQNLACVAEHQTQDRGLSSVSVAPLFLNQPSQLAATAMQVQH
jgi:hypothetical protein